MNKIEELVKLRNIIKDCTKCAICGNKVFDIGNVNADIFLVAEAPGAVEEEKGIPLVGKSGQLINKMLEGIDISREEIWVGNTLCCRPPDNRAPLPEEIKSCIPFLYKQIEIIKPKIVVVLGSFAASTLLEVKTPISKLAGKWFASDKSDIKLFASYHPSYVLRGAISENDYLKHFEEIKKGITND